jgi:CDP-diacylglycerol--serine O-phosphatidyltransferase
MLLVGALFDGFDGAAARRFGGTRWGVISDDVADAVNFALAPGAALLFTIGGSEGIVVGGLFTVFTLGRLVFFTLRKGTADPKYFDGVPSTVGGIIALSALILFPEHPVAVGALVGAACALMISFGSAYRHLGRTAAKHRRLILAISPLLVSPFVLAGLIYGPPGAISVLLLGCVAYGLTPTLRAFRSLRAP